MENPEHVQADQAFYTSQCKFPDVPEWARLYVGYCYFNSLMVGYDTGAFGADDGVTPAAACTVVLRYMDLPDIQWDYNTACQTALDHGLTSVEAVAKTEVTRGDLAIMLYRALGNTDFEGSTVTEEPEGTISRNTDGSINLPADGSQYVPQEGDVIRCDDGTNYTITDVSRWDKNMFASGPIGPACLSQPVTGLARTGRITESGGETFPNQTGDHLRILNLCETRRMLYTLYNAIGDSSTTWENGAPVSHLKRKPTRSHQPWLFEKISRPNVLALAKVRL